MAFESQPSLGAMGLHELPEELGLAHARLADDGDHLPLTGSGPLNRLAELVQLGVTPHKAGQAPCRSRLEPRAGRTGPGHFVNLQRGAQALN